MSFDINELGGGSKSWNPAMGDKISGTVVSFKRVQQTGFDDGKPLTWDDGTPRMQSVVELQTDLGDEDDDGIRSIWLKGGKKFEPAEGTGTSGEEALVAAVKEAGSTTIDEGAKLIIVCSGIAKKTNPRFQPAKLYTMKYEPPKQSVSVDDMFGDD